MKKNVILLISAILMFISVNLSAQEEINLINKKLFNLNDNNNYSEVEGCPFRFVLESPIGTGWSPSYGINITVDGDDYGILRLPWGTLSAEETIIFPSGEVQVFWIGGPSSAFEHYFKIYNSIDELIYTTPIYILQQNEKMLDLQNQIDELKNEKP